MIHTVCNILASPKSRVACRSNVYQLSNLLVGIPPSHSFDGVVNCATGRAEVKGFQLKGMKIEELMNTRGHTSS